MAEQSTPPQVLIVDDSPEDRAILARLLTRAPGPPYAIEQATTGEAALAAIRCEGFDCTCVLLDYHLPDMDGLAVLAELRAIARTEQVPVVLLTGAGDEALAVRALQEGAQDYLSKSGITAEGLRRAVENAIEKCDLARRLAAERRRLTFLTEVGVLLAASLDLGQTLSRVAQLAVPYLADWCVIELVEADRTVREVAVAHSDPAKEELARELQRRFPPEVQGAADDDGFAAPRPPLLVPVVTDDVLAERTSNAEQLALVRAIGPRSYVIVPLLLRGRSLGFMALAITESARRYDADDLALAEELARRAAVALDNARLFRREREAVRTRERFLAVAAHELKNPLTAVRGYAQLLERQVRRALPDDERTRRAAERIVAETGRMQGLVDDLLDTAQLQRGQLPLQRAWVDLAALTRRVVARHAETQGAGGGTRSSSTRPSRSTAWWTPRGSSKCWAT